VSSTKGVTEMNTVKELVSAFVLFVKIALLILVALVSIAFFSEAKAHGAPKMLICMETAFAAGEAFEMKASKRKLVYPTVDDLIFAALIKVAMDKGYKAKSYQEAVKIGHDSCAESKLWAEINFE
jgi:hypothetical protein